MNRTSNSFALLAPSGSDSEKSSLNPSPPLVGLLKSSQPSSLEMTAKTVSSLPQKTNKASPSTGKTGKTKAQGIVSDSPSKSYKVLVLNHLEYADCKNKSKIPCPKQSTPNLSSSIIEHLQAIQLQHQPIEIGPDLTRLSPVSTCYLSCPVTENRGL